MESMSSEAEELWRVMEHSQVAFAYFDSGDRLLRWNEAYEDLNFRIRPLLRRGALFSELLAELILRGQIRIPKGKQQEWISQRLRARRHGVTAFRELADGRTFLAQERRDHAGGTLGFWMDVSDPFRTGAFKGAEGALMPYAYDMADPGCQDMLRTKLQTVLMTLEHLSTVPACAEEQAAIGDAIAATESMGACLDLVRTPGGRPSSMI